MRGRHSTWSTFIEVRGSRATIDYIGRRFGLRGRRSIWGPSGSFCVAGAALGAPLARLAWQAQHLEHLHRGQRKPGDDCLHWAPLRAQHLGPIRLVLRGRCSTWSTFIEVRGSRATIDYIGRRFVLRGRPWQAQHLEHLHRGPRKSRRLITFIPVKYYEAVSNPVEEHRDIVFLRTPKTPTQTTTQRSSPQLRPLGGLYGSGVHLCMPVLSPCLNVHHQPLNGYSSAHP